MITFGPVPSRRLGQSLGINNIPPKNCTYSCVYCQLGRTKKTKIALEPFYNPREIVRQVKAKVSLAEHACESIDFLTFVADGEPTLDRRLGETIDLLHPVNIKIAVITNSSLIWNEHVLKSLKMADWVSLKIDTMDERTWHKINRPHGSLDLEKIKSGIVEFDRHYTGQLVTETMLVRDLNDKDVHIKQLAEFLQDLNIHTSYLSIPTRPPAESRVKPPTEESVIHAHHILSSHVKHVELLIGYEGNAFAFTGHAETDLLNITAVHPMRKEAVLEFLRKAGADWSVIDHLVAKGLLVQKEFQGHTYFARNLSSS